MLRKSEKIQVRKISLLLTLLAVSILNHGCVAILAAGAVTGATQYVKYAVDNISNRTFSGNLDHVTQACLDVLKKMKIAVNIVKTDKEGAKIHASAHDLSIRISLYSITDNATKVSIDASKFALLKDKATADEIISQIDVTLTDQRVLLGKRIL